MLLSCRNLMAGWLVFAPAAMIAAPQSAYAESSLAPEISLDELKTVVEKKSATIIDVNGNTSFAKAHIPGAIHFESNKANFSKVLPSDKNALIIAYCGGPMCTAWEDAAKEAKALGYTNIKHYKGGIKTWVSSGLKTEKKSS